MPTQSSREKQIFGYLFALTATALWSGNFVIARDLSSDVPPVTIAFWRWTVALIAITPFAIKSLIKDYKLIKQHLPYFLITSVLGITTFNTLIYIASHTTTATNLALIAITFPIFILILSRIVFKEAITTRKVIGIILVAIGVVLIITKGSIDLLLHLSFSIGDVWMLMAALVFATYSILLKRKPKKISLWGFQMSTFILGLILLVPFYVWETSTVQPLVFESKTIMSFLYIGIFASLTSFVMWNKAVVNIGATKAGMIYYLMPVFSGILAHFVLKEVIGVLHLLSAILIISGIVIANRVTNKT